MSAEREAQLLFTKHGGVLRTRDALVSGIHPRTLYRMREAGTIERLSRGVYRLASSPPLDQPDLITVALRIPRGVVCLISALAHHELTSEIPHEVWIALPRGTRTPILDHPPIRIVQLSKRMYAAGVEVAKIGPAEISVYSAAKTIADCFRFRNQIGLDVAVDALRRCLDERRAKPAEILEYARLWRVERVMRPYLEALH